MVSVASRPLVVAALVAPLISGLVQAGDDAAAPTPLELFEERILPIFKSEKPSSCIQCHLASVDLKDYILPSQEKTFASLRDQGLVDLERPERSKILTLIQMGEKDKDEGVRLIHEKTRKAEYEAFAAWIKACCADAKLRKLPAAGDSDLARPDRPDAVIRHARKSRVVDSFVRNVWSQRMRCFPCHTPHELDPSNPKHQRPIERAKEFAAEFGEAVASRLKIFRETPEETLRYLIEDSRTTPPGRLPLINIEDPLKSLLILKPTARLPKKTDTGRDPPSYLEPVSHMGGIKMHGDDQSYKAWVAWLRDYARVARDEYASVDDLPADNWYPSKHVVIVRDTPEAWESFTRVQFFLYRWSEAADRWHEEPIAFTQGTVTPRRRVAGALFLLRSPAAGEAETWDPEESTLARGRYLLKAFVDSEKRLADDPLLMLGDAEYYGATELRGPWQKGFKLARKLAGARFEASPR